MNIDAAIQRLNTLLPLKQRQNNLCSELKSLHQAELQSLVNHGRSLQEDEMKQHITGINIDNPLQLLAAEDLVVLDKQHKNLVGAYPVTLEQTPHRIVVNGNTIYAMCALDAVSIAPMFDTYVEIYSRCHVSKEPITIKMQGSAIVTAHPSTQIIVGIRWQTPSNIAAHSMCTEMVFFNDTVNATIWYNQDQKNISLFSLQDAATFGKAYFMPLLG